MRYHTRLEQYNAAANSSCYIVTVAENFRAAAASARALLS